VQKAFRTAGLVRGPHPYALVIDDIQKDTSSHDYRWNMAVEHDIQIASTQAQGGHQLDVLLTGGDPQQKDGWGGECSSRPNGFQRNHSCRAIRPAHPFS
jgi:hypothetical protein